MGDWYYIGHYGQLGPLTREQIDELIDGEVIAHDTYVWRVGMSEWVPAARVTELSVRFSTMAASIPPPPPGPSIPQRPVSTPIHAPFSDAPVYASYQNRTLVTLKSDRSPIIAGILQLIIPGVGRMYLGYGALGVLQLLSTLCGGIGWVWSFIDGILILVGSIKFDGYGRRLGD